MVFTIITTFTIHHFLTDTEIFFTNHFHIGQLEPNSQLRTAFGLIVLIVFLFSFSSLFLVLAHVAGGAVVQRVKRWTCNQ